MCSSCNDFHFNCILMIQASTKCSDLVIHSLLFSYFMAFVVTKEVWQKYREGFFFSWYIFSSIFCVGIMCWNKYYTIKNQTAASQRRPTEHLCLRRCSQQLNWCSKCTEGHKSNIISSFVHMCYQIIHSIICTGQTANRSLFNYNKIQREKKVSEINKCHISCYYISEFRISVPTLDLLIWLVLDWNE